MRRFKYCPKEFSFSKAKRRRVEALLARCPRTAPQVEIRPYAGEPFTVAVQEELPFGMMTPLRLGVERFSADYSAADGAFLEASLMVSPRYVRVAGIWCLESYSTGGDYQYWEAGQPFGIMWHGNSYLHLKADEIAYVDVLLPRPQIAWRMPFPKRISVGDEFDLQCPDQTSIRAEGCYTLTFGATQHECVKLVVTTREADTDKDGSNLVTRDEKYIARNGATVLVRRQTTRAHLEWMHEQYEKHGMPDAHIAKLLEQDKGEEFMPWFDIFTDVCLQPLMRRSARNKIV
jgi:hypothetical protein